MHNRLASFTNDELSALAFAMGHSSSPLLGTLPTEVEEERLSRLSEPEVGDLDQLIGVDE